jgi:trans-2,3-dihydro-3-hydroxyanthranilate isomerase
VLPPDDSQNACRLRIFTPAMELPMAGHPTVGTAVMLARLGRIPRSGSVRFEEGVGPVGVTMAERSGGRLQATMSQPAPHFGPIIDDREGIAALVSLDADDLLSDFPVQAVSSGVPFVYIPVQSLEAAGRARVRLDLWEQMLKDSDAPHIFVFTTETVHQEATVHGRMFAPAMGITEDPATGAASGPLGAYLVRYGMVAQQQSRAILSEQGIEMGRPSFIHIVVELSGEAITSVTVGGGCVYMGEGQFTLPDDIA